MSCMLYKHRDFIFKLAKLKNNKLKLLDLIKNSTNGQIKAIGELSYNILHGGVSCSHYRKKKLKPYSNSLRILANKKISLKNKKTRILKGNGVLLTSLIPFAISAIASLMGRH